MNALDNVLRNKKMHVFLGALFIIALALNQLGRYNHNDHMYLATATLVNDHTLYENIPFTQTPLNAYIYGAAHAVVDADFLFILLKFVSVFLTIATVFLFARLAGYLAGERYEIAAIAFVLLGTNADVISGADELSNYALPLFLLAFGSYIYFVFDRYSIAAALVGLSCGLAASSKISFGIFVLAFAVLYMINRETRPFFPFYLGGAVIGSLPILIGLIDGGWSQFVFFNIEYHLFTNMYRDTELAVPPKSVPEGIRYFFARSIPAVGLAALAWIINYRGVLGNLSRNSVQARAILVLFFAGLVVAIVPGVYFEEYWNAASTLLIVACAMIIASSWDKAILRQSTIGLVLILLVFNIGKSAVVAAERVETGEYAVLEAFSAREQLEDAIDEALMQHPQCVRNILTASAVPVVGSRVPLSVASAGGSFLFRLDNVVSGASPANRKYTNVENYLLPNSALLVGYYPESQFERRIESAARERRYFLKKEIEFLGRPLRLYLPATCHSVDLVPERRVGATPGWDQPAPPVP